MGTCSDVPPRGSRWGEGERGCESERTRAPGDTSLLIIFCMPSVNGRMWEPSSTGNVGMGMGLGRSNP